MCVCHWNLPVSRLDDDGEHEKLGNSSGRPVRPRPARKSMIISRPESYSSSGPVGWVAGEAHECTLARRLAAAAAGKQTGPTSHAGHWRTFLRHHRLASGPSPQGDSSGDRQLHSSRVREQWGQAGRRCCWCWWSRARKALATS